MMRRYFDENDEAFYYPPAWYLWPLWWLALPALVAIDKIQCWIVSRNLWRSAKPGRPMDTAIMDAVIREHYSPERAEAMAKQQSMLANWKTNDPGVKWGVFPVDPAEAKPPTDKDPEDGTD